ncbi:MAG: hypothetical protein KKA73_19920 [Chloroflexi bacterium]|nr:hypothetical protein [Chloroflexota bacterium]MBU1749957.1 hypothetical protein [Chloroflexota bacterium]
MLLTSRRYALFNPLPAVVIGGPPHSGKSVLAYSLTQALRERDVPHYLLRAYPPDYEGDWFHEADQDWVRHRRLKGARSEAWLPLLHADIARRHLPLLVDLGGLPSPAQEALLDDCTHAILLTPNQDARLEWADRFSRHGLVFLADLHSDRHGTNQLEQAEPLLLGTLASLERGCTAQGPAFGALTDRLADLFTAAAPDLRQRHLEDAPTELAVDLDRLARQMARDPHDWQPADLAAVLDYLPAGQPLALYGRGPNWLYAAIAVHAHPAALHLFDVRQGWVETLPIAPGEPGAAGALTAHCHVLAPDTQLLEFRLPDAYLDPAEAGELRRPPDPAPPAGVILSGKLPLWLWTALARSYAAPWVAVLQPQTQGAVVIKSVGSAPPLGTVLPVLTVLP